MIKLTYEEINNKMMEMALAKLARHVFPVKVSWNIQRILRQMDKEVREGREIYMALLKTTCEVDEKGELVLQKGPLRQPDGTVLDNQPIPGSFVVKNEEDFKKRNEDFLKLEIELQSFPILLKDLEDVKISPEDLLALTPLIIEEGLSIVQ